MTPARSYTSRRTRLMSASTTDRSAYAISSDRGPVPSSPPALPRAILLVAVGTLLALLIPGRPVRAESEFIKPFLPLQVSTVPSNGDLNPYGLAFVPPDFPSGG